MRWRPARLALLGLASLVLAGVVRAGDARSTAPGAVADRAALEALIPAAAPRKPLVEHVSRSIGDPRKLALGAPLKVLEEARTTGATEVALASRAVIAGVPCIRELVVRDESWGCELAEAWSHDGFVTKAGGWLQLHYGTGKRAAMSFAELEPARERLVLDAVACQGSARFHRDGRLRETTLAARATFGGATLPAGSEVHLRPDGSLAMAFLVEATVLGGRRVPAGIVELDEAGRVVHVAPTWPRATVVLPSGKRLEPEVAASPADRELGLMYRDESEFGPDDAMLFVFERAERHRIWTKGCRFAIDLLWISAARRVVHLAAELPPCAVEPCAVYEPPRDALYVLALHRGAVAASRIRIGDAIELTLGDASPPR